jgi:membrane-bound metal-dependent hydrolase YbcI (DUF457 family)
MRVGKTLLKYLTSRERPATTPHPEASAYVLRERIIWNVFIGHALLAFALAVLFAEWRGWPARRALTLGAVMGAFAALPDVDVVYAVVALDAGRFLGNGLPPSAFWEAANSVHRSMTHSLLIALVAGPLFGIWTLRGRTHRTVATRSVAAAVLVGVVGVAIAVSGPLGGIVMGAFVAVGVAIAAATRRVTNLSARTVGLAATIGLLTHPWGDLVTGQPPQLLYPFETAVLSERIVLHPDPTMHLLGAFGIELATIWFATLAVVVVTDRTLWTVTDGTAGLGATYGAAAFVLVPPTLDVSYHFVFSILAVGAACGVLSWYRTRPRLSPVTRPAAVDLGAGFAYWGIALAGTTLALAGYAAVYAAMWL